MKAALWFIIGVVLGWTMRRFQRTIYLRTWSGSHVALSWHNLFFVALGWLRFRIEGAILPWRRRRPEVGGCSCGASFTSLDSLYEHIEREECQ